MLSLFMSSEAHRGALVKFLKMTHVPQEILVYQFEGVVNNIAASLSLGFSNEELPDEGRNHNKALHISIECVDTILSRVLVDTGSSLNVMPKGSLAKLTIEGLVMKPSELVVREFDGLRRTVIGEVDMPMKIGPHTLFITFIVMDIHPAYRCLLGRSWIHSARAVTSMLHQRLKFFVDDKLVVVEGEEDIMVIHVTSFRYVEGEGEMNKISFQSFEVINIEIVSLSPSTSTNDNSAIVSYDFDTPSNHVDEDCDEDSELPEKLERLLKQESKVIQPHEEVVELVNLRINEENKEVKVGLAL
ncbi:hypothetical protein KIW84_011294 [Lathyrus oleraceus]|uniref:Uncharacterized protein n=1 Tax=Pisum sativum TaxID=3888 RepID=A0A9D4YPZ3_PEA|nr:hypothetical protein KIW84_011294 [Pisum sativum]